MRYTIETDSSDQATTLIWLADLINDADAFLVEHLMALQYLLYEVSTREDFDRIKGIQGHDHRRTMIVKCCKAIVEKLEA